MDKNPFIEPENYFKGYEKSIEDLRNSPQIIEFDKLCFEVFERNESGKRFLELIKERYIIPSLVKVGTPTYQIDVLWAEGFKEFGRMIISAIQSHQQRIVAGNN